MRVVRASIVAIGNTIAIAVAIPVIGHAIVVTISMISATASAWAHIGKAAGQKTADDDQRYSKLLHTLLLDKMAIS